MKHIHYTHWYIGIITLIGLGFFVWHIVDTKSFTTQTAVVTGCMIGIVLMSFIESVRGKW